MSTENTDNSELNATQEHEENRNQAKEVTVLKRNLRLLKRMILGKKKPPFFLRMVCVVNFAWSGLMILYYGILGFAISLKAQYFIGGYFDELGAKMFLVLVFLHLIAIFGVILMYRKKALGFYIYSIAALLMPIYMMVNASFSEVFIMFASSLVMIVLFAMNYKTLGLKFTKNKKED